jgi:hypothetical protein
VKTEQGAERCFHFGRSAAIGMTSAPRRTCPVACAQAVVPTAPITARSSLKLRARALLNLGLKFVAFDRPQIYHLGS